MGQSDSLRGRKAQHQPKNTKSKKDDNAIQKSMIRVINYLQQRFEGHLGEYTIEFDNKIDIAYMIELIREKGIRYEFDLNYLDRRIKPDGGILYLTHRETEKKRPVLIAEIKRQGTNDQREKEGKEKQAVGNAIERLGKNLIGIKSMMNHEKITPFVCFGWGCDFAPEEKTVLSKVSMLNEFYPLNRTYVFKRDGNADHSRYAPVSMYFRETVWEEDEMFEIMKEIAETSLRYYIF